MTSGNGLFARLSRTRQSLTNSLKTVFSARPSLDDSIYEEIEDHLIMADMGATTSQGLVERLKTLAKSDGFSTTDQLLGGLKTVMKEILDVPVSNHEYVGTQGPIVILMVGVNGVGKTTTLAKMANRLKNEGHSVMLAACDTFRAAAIEQLQTWGERLDIPVIAQPHGSDAAAVAFDALTAAKARNVDYLLIDSAGRQHTHGDLMDQLQKIKRVLAKSDEFAPHEVYLTVDAGNGQNVLSQVENFQKTITLTGLCVTKLDGTARGGVVLALTERFGLPIRYIGVGEGIDDLRSFSAEDFVEALLPEFESSEAG